MRMHERLGIVLVASQPASTESRGSPLQGSTMAVVREDEFGISDLLKFCEREFGIRIGKAEYFKFFLREARAGSGVLILNSIRVKDFVSFVESTIKSQKRPSNTDVFSQLKPQIAKFLNVGESKITQSMWLINAPPTWLDRWRDYLRRLFRLPLNE